MGQSIGVENTKGLLQPGEDSIIDSNGLVDNSPTEEVDANSEQLLQEIAANARANYNEKSEGESDVQDTLSKKASQESTGRTLYDINYADYADYIDRPFSFISDDAEDLRAYGQSAGEKFAHGLPKLVTRVGTNVLGSTVGLAYGGVEFLAGAVTPGESATKNFFDNDFQRSLDGINDWMDDKLPAYYTKEEKDYNFFQSMGTANFWANDFSNGLSFVIGAVLSESLTRGAATSNVVARAKQLFGRNAKKYMGSGKTAEAVKDAFKKDIINKKQISNATTTLRQLGTGASYEAGVEARHHYDESLKHLVEKYQEDHLGNKPGKAEMAGLVDIATKSANAVFAGNVALVGYSNYMMFPKIFGKGMNATRGGMKGAVGSEIKSKARAYRELFKNMGKKEVVARNTWRVLKTPLYEGFGEEGGQKLLDLSGQSAALSYYSKKRDGVSSNMVTELLNHMDDRFTDVYGSKEGQKEIGIGFLLAAIGLPTRVNTKTKEGKDVKKWQMNGAWQSIREGKAYKKAVTNLKERLQSSPDAVAAFAKNYDTLVRDGVIQDTKDFASVIDSPWMFKNAQNDEMYNFISARLDAGLESEIYNDVEMIRGMSNDEFRDKFLYKEKNDLTDSELEARRNKIADAMLERTETIKQTKAMVDKTFVNYGEQQKDAIVHAMAVADNADIREDAIIAAIEAATGMTMDHTEYEDKAKAGMAEIADSKTRNYNVVQRLPAIIKENIENSPEGMQVKRKLGIKEFTDPTHIEELYSVLLQKKADLQSKLEAISADSSLTNAEKDSKQEEVGKQMDEVLDRMTALAEGIKDALDPDISAMEQDYLDRWKKSDPSGYAKNSEDVLQKIKDMRKIRARRHRAISMYNELLDLKEDLVWNPSWSNPLKFEGGEKIAAPEMMLQRLMDYNKTMEETSLNDKDLERLYRRHRGSVVEFEYETKKGVKTYRFLVKDTIVKSGEDKVLMQLPSIENLAMLRKLDGLKHELAIANDMNDVGAITMLSHDIAELEAKMKEEDMQTEHVAKNLKFLLQAKNGIRTISWENIIQENIEGSIDFVANEVNKSFDEVTSSLKENRELLEKATQELRQFIQDKIASPYAKVEAKRRAKFKDEISNLNKAVVQATEQVNVLEVKITTFKEGLETIHSLKEKSKTVTTEEGVANLIDEIFKIQWGTSRNESFNELFDNLGHTILKKALSKDKDSMTLEKFRFLPENDAIKNNGDELRAAWKARKSTLSKDDVKGQLIKLGNILNGGSKYARDLIVKMDPKAKQLQDRVNELGSDIEALSKLYVIEDGIKWSGDNKGKGSAQGRAAFEAVIKEKTLLEAQLGEMEAEMLEHAQALEAEIENFHALTNAVAVHYNYIKNKIQELTTPKHKSKEYESEFDTKKSEIKSLEDLLKQAEESQLDKDSSKRAFLHSSPISVMEMMKTTGAHDAAIREMKDLLEKKKLGEKIDPIRFMHVQSQLRFFKYIGEVYNKVSEGKNRKKRWGNLRFMIAHKNIIPSELEDKITFYDETSGAFKLTKDVTGNILDESKESIKLILTDSKGKIILEDGQPIYSDLPSSEVWKKAKDKNGKEVKIYRFGESDLIPESIKRIVMYNGRTAITGKLKATSKLIINRHIKRRNEMLQLTSPKLLKITGKGFTLLYRPDGEYTTPARPSKTLVSKKVDIKDVFIGISKAENGMVTVNSKTFKVSPGFTYIMVSGNLVPLRVNKFTGDALTNLHNTFKLLASNNLKYENGEISYEESILMSKDHTKTIMQSLMDSVYIGKHSYEKSAEHRKFNVTGNKIMFGKDIIEFHQLLNPSDNVDINKKFSHFLSTLHHQVNSYSLGLDIKSRETVQTKYALENKKYHASKSKKYAKGKGNKKGDKYKKAVLGTPEYTEFFEFKVGENLEVETIKWNNYTEYLLGDGQDNNRPLDQMPTYTNLVEKTDDVMFPQFLNPLLRLDSKTLIEDLEDIDDASKIEEVEEQVEEREEDNLADDYNTQYDEEGITSLGDLTRDEETPEEAVQREEEEALAEEAAENAISWGTASLEQKRAILRGAGKSDSEIINILESLGETEDSDLQVDEDGFEEFDSMDDNDSENNCKKK